LAREAGLCGGGGYGVSDGGQEDEHEVQAQFLVRQVAYTRRGRGDGAPKGTSWEVIEVRPHAHGARGADTRRRVAKGARDRSAARPRIRRMVPRVFGGTKVARGPPPSFGVHTPESADDDAWQERSRRPWRESSSPTPGCWFYFICADSKMHNSLKWQLS
jgi:hypothetical protein